jgi:hypothetical protein
MLSDGLGIIDHSLQTGFEEVAHQNTHPALTSTESGSQVSTPAQPSEVTTPVRSDSHTASVQTLLAPQVLDTQTLALQNFAHRASKVPGPVGGGGQSEQTPPGGIIFSDGGFEDGGRMQNNGDCNGPELLTGLPWWCEHDPVFTNLINSPGGAHSGNWYLSTGAVGADARIAQIIGNTVPDQAYLVQFWFANGGGTPNDINLVVDGVNRYSQVNDGAHGYAQVGRCVNATGTQMGLEFLVRQDPSFFSIDDVTVTPIVSC